MNERLVPFIIIGTMDGSKDSLGLGSERRGLRDARPVGQCYSLAYFARQGGSRSYPFVVTSES